MYNYGELGFLVKKTFFNEPRPFSDVKKLRHSDLSWRPIFLFYCFKLSTCKFLVKVIFRAG